jgi:hypothetical protein
MSVFYQILDAVRDRLATIPSVPTIVIRKRPVLVQEDTVPIVIVSPGREVIGDEAFGNIVEYLYSVEVTIIQAGNRVYEADVATLFDLRENIRNQLFQPLLSGAASVYDCQLETNPAFEVVSGQASNYDISGMVITYKSVETRIS